MSKKVIKVSNHMDSTQYILLLLGGILFAMFVYCEHGNSSFRTNFLGHFTIITWLFAVINFNRYRRSDHKDDINKIEFAKSQVIISYLSREQISFSYLDIKNCTFSLNVSHGKIGKIDDSKTHLKFTILFNDGKTYTKWQQINNGFFRKSYVCAIDALKCKKLLDKLNMEVIATGNDEVALKKIEFYRLVQKTYITTEELILIILLSFLALIFIFIGYDLYFH